MASPRLLLIEYVPDEPLRQQRTEPFPFWVGFVRAQGGEARWVAVEAGAEARPHDPFEVDPGGALRDTLLAEVRAFHPTQIVANERAHPGWRAALAQASGGAPLHEPGGALERLSHVDGLRAALGLGPTHEPPADELHVFEHARPDYDRHLVHPTRPTRLTLTPLIVLPFCQWRAPTSRAPFFAGLSRSAGARGQRLLLLRSGGRPRPAPPPARPGGRTARAGRALA